MFWVSAQLLIRTIRRAATSQDPQRSSFDPRRQRAYWVRRLDWSAGLAVRHARSIDRPCLEPRLGGRRGEHWASQYAPPPSRQPECLGPDSGDSMVARYR
jgi:hypothetical protein